MAAGSKHPFRFAVQGANAESGAQFLDTVRRAEDLGYSAFHLSDHYLGPGKVGTGVQALAATPAMAAAAAVTSSIRIGCRVFCVDFHHPAVLVKEMATVELISNGRLEFGLGAGWVADEYAALGIPFDSAGTRIDRLTEVIAFTKAYFSGEEINAGGEHVKVAGVVGTPAAIQKPHPPLMIGGGAKRVLTLAGSVADIVSLNFNNRAGVVGPDGVKSSTAEATDERIEWIKAGAGDRFDRIELEVGAYFTVVTDDAAVANGAAEKMGGMFGVDAATMKSHPNALFGSVNQIVEELQARRERHGISYITVGDKNMEAFAPVVAALAGS
jgi:probable F420-dependent oxidoreductase